MPHILQFPDPPAVAYKFSFGEKVPFVTTEESEN